MRSEAQRLVSRPVRSRTLERFAGDGQTVAVGTLQRSVESQNQKHLSHLGTLKLPRRKV